MDEDEVVAPAVLVVTESSSPQAETARMTASATKRVLGDLTVRAAYREGPSTHRMLGPVATDAANESNTILRVQVAAGCEAIPPQVVTSSMNRRFQ